MAAEGGTIDSLSIEIGASTDGAARKISGLVSALKELKDVSKVTISSTLSGRIKELAGALNALSTEKIGNLGRLANAIKAFSDVGNVSIPKNFANNLFDLAAAASEISPEQVRNLNDLGNAIRNGLGSLEDSFSEKIKNVGNALTYFTNIKTGAINKALPGQLAEIGTVIRQFNDDDLAALSEVSGALQKLGGSSIRISEDAPERLQKLVDVIAGISNDDIGRIERITTALQRLQGVNLKGLGESVRGLSGITFSEGMAGLKASANGLNKTMQNATKTYKIINSLGRVAFYRMIRSAIKAVTDALAEGTTNAYNFSKALGDSTPGIKTIAEAYDNLATVNFKLTNQLGAAWASLIRAVEPILVRLVNLVTMAANAITQLFAAFGGSGTYLKAIDYNKEWGETAGKAAKAAKEWKNQLLGFDEINRLEEPGDGGGGGGGAATPDFSKMFAITPVNGALQDFVNMVKEHILELELFAESAMLGIGLALLFSGANIPLGLALTAVGAASLIKTVTENWDAIKEKIGGAMAGIMVLTGLAFGVGAALAFSGVNVPLGLALMAAGLIGMASAAALNWDDMPEKLRRAIGDINMVLGGAFLALGLILTLATPALSPIGIGLIAAGLATGALGVAINWEYMKSNIGNALRAIMSVAASAMLAVGLLLSLTGANIPLGLALIAAGAATFVASASINWDTLKSALSGTLGFIMTIAGGAMLAVGLILACTGVALPLGLALMAAGGAALGVGATHYDWDALPNKIHEVTEKIKGHFSDAWDWVKEKLGFAQEDISSNSAEIIFDVESDIGQASDVIQDFGTTSTESLSTVPAAMQDVKTSISDMSNEGVTSIAGLAEAMETSGTGITESLNGISQSANDVMNSLMGGVGYNASAGAGEGYEMSGTGMQGMQSSAGWDSVISKLQEVADQATETENAYRNLSESIGESMDAISGSMNDMATSWDLNSRAISESAEEVNGLFEDLQATVEGTTNSNIQQFELMSNGFMTAQSVILDGIEYMKEAMQDFRASWHECINGMIWDMLDFALYTVDAAGYVVEALLLIERAAYRAAIAMMMLSAITGMFGGGGGGVSTSSVPAFASGGFPEDGLFMANHGELVGQFSNGKTAVANNQEITEGIAQATYSAFMQAMSDSGSNKKNSEIVLNINGREFARATYDDTKEVARERGASLVANA